MAARPVAVIVHYKGVDDTRSCLLSLEGKLDRGSVILVDNGPSGEAMELARMEFPGLVALTTGENLGWAGGSNLGIKHALSAGATHILLLNPDATAEPGFLEPLIEAASQADVGIVGGKVLLPRTGDEPRRIWSAGCGYNFLRLTHSRGEGQLDASPYDQPCDVDFVSGCFALVRSDVFEKLGLFDESFFLYYEDAELCLRAWRSGYRVVYEPRAVVTHKVHGSTGSAPGQHGPITWYYTTRNQIAFARHRMSLVPRSIFVLGLFVRRLIRGAYEISQNRPHHVRAIACGLRDGLLGRMGIAPEGAIVERKSR